MITLGHLLPGREYGQWRPRFRAFLAEWFHRFYHVEGKYPCEIPITIRRPVDPNLPVGLGGLIVHGRGDVERYRALRGEADDTLSSATDASEATDVSDATDTASTNSYV